MQPILSDLVWGDGTCVRRGRAGFSQNGAPVEVRELRRIKTVPDPLDGPSVVHNDDLSAHDVAGVRWKICRRALICVGDDDLFVTDYGRPSVRKADGLVIPIEQRLLAGDGRLRVGFVHRPGVDDSGSVFGSQPGFVYQ